MWKIAMKYGCFVRLSGKCDVHQQSIVERWRIEYNLSEFRGEKMQIFGYGWFWFIF